MGSNLRKWVIVKDQTTRCHKPLDKTAGMATSRQAGTLALYKRKKYLRQGKKKGRRKISQYTDSFADWMIEIEKVTL